MTNIVSLNFFRNRRNSLKKVVLIGGAFDIIHSGHISHFKKAKSLGDTLIVHIASDKRIREKKGPGRPIFKERDRAKIVSAIRFVDYAFIYGGRHYDQEVIDRIQPDILFFNKEAYTSQVQEKVKNLKNFNGKVVVSKENKVDSTTRAIKDSCAKK